MKSEAEIKRKLEEWREMVTEFFLLKAKAPTDKQEQKMHLEQMISSAWCDALEWVLDNERQETGKNG